MLPSNRSYLLSLVKNIFKMLDLNNLERTKQKIQTFLQSEDRRKREKIVSDVHESFRRCGDDTGQFLKLFDSIRSELWEAVNDKAEIVRVRTIDMLLDVFKNIPCENKYLEEVLPVILYRLGKDELTHGRHLEQSEHLRMKLVNLLNILCERYEDRLELYISEIINILKVTLTDRYSIVIQESTKCCIILSKMTCQSMFEKSHELVNSLCNNICHKHYMTRVSAINALCAVLKEANWKLLDSQYIFGYLWKALSDENPSVRLALVKLIGSWLVDLRDRYSYFGLLVPLMLCCLCDEQAEIATAAYNLWNAAGCQYLNENEQELKDKLDFLEEKPEHYPSGVERSNLGCRTLVTRHVYKIEPIIINGLSNNLIYAKLLSLTILHAEGGLTQHLEKLLQAMYRVATSKEIPLSQTYIDKSAEYLGFFIPASTWTQLVICTIKSEATPANLFILAALIRGTCPKHMDPYLDQLTEVLAIPTTYGTICGEFQLEVLKCCRALLDNVSEFGESATCNLFLNIYFIIALSSFDEDQQPLTKAGEDCLELLANKTGVSVKTMTENFLMPLMLVIAKTVNCWSAAHPHFRLLHYLLDDSEWHWFVAKDAVRELLCIAIALENCDAQVKGFLLSNLTKAFENKEFKIKVGEEAHREYALGVIEDLIVPNLTWRAGLKAEKLRTILLTCLRLILEQTDEVTIPYLTLIPAVKSAVVDGTTVNRVLALQSLNDCVQCAISQSTFTYEVFNDIYFKVIERLDDRDNKVREATLATLKTMISNIPLSMNEKSYNYVFTHVATALVPHLDDENDALARSVCETIKLLAVRAPTITKEKLKSKMKTFKNQHLCQEVIEFISTVYFNC